MAPLPRALGLVGVHGEGYPSYKWVQYKETQKLLAARCLWGVADLPTLGLM